PNDLLGRLRCVTSVAAYKDGSTRHDSIEKSQAGTGDSASYQACIVVSSLHDLTSSRDGGLALICSPIQDAAASA
ncbi:hypothetical protein LTR16_002952, partial [Cryomyces antarcticus]